MSYSAPWHLIEGNSNSKFTSVQNLCINMGLTAELASSTLEGRGLSKHAHMI